MFSKKKGELVSLRHDGDELLVKGPQLNVWRGATDNDGIKRWSGQQNKALGKWLKAGLDKIKLSHCDAAVIQTKGDAVVTIRQCFKCRGTGCTFKHEHQYTVTVTPFGVRFFDCVLVGSCLGFTRRWSVMSFQQHDGDFKVAKEGPSTDELGKNEVRGL